MRYPVSFLVFFGALLVFAGSDVMAQTTPASPAKPLTRRELRQQDRNECAKHVDRTQADLFLQCMADRRMARKLAAKKKK